MPSKKSIFINFETLEWKSKSQVEKDAYCEDVFKYYRERGFPYYEYTEKQKKNEIKKLINYNFSPLISNGVIKQTMHGLGLAWSYFPDSWKVKCGSMRTPMEVFLDDDLFRQAIKKRTQIGTYMSDSGMRKILRMFTGTQGVSNFRPTAAGAIYEHYGGEGVTWDMSSGYGGRFLGAATSSNIKEYIGTDPCSSTFIGLKNMESDLHKFGRKDFLSRLLKIGSEEHDLYDMIGDVDLCFTSPPYFNKEKYSDETTQSYIKYPKKSKWLEAYFEKTIKNCFTVLKPKGFLILNVANTSTFPNFEQQTQLLAKKIGFIYHRSLKLKLSGLMKSDYKYEPIFVWQKPRTN
jgi:hypothetical protein